jgi:hypothetical protein
MKIGSAVWAVPLSKKKTESHGSDPLICPIANKFLESTHIWAEIIHANFGGCW